MMLDITSRDQAARSATWETPQGPVELPAVIHPHTPQHPAPEHAQLCIGPTSHDSIPTLTHHGTLLETRREPPSEPDELTVPRSLIYPGNLDEALHDAADQTTPPDAPVQIRHNLDNITPHNGLLITPTARSIADDPWHLARYLTTARERAGPNAILYTPGIGRPDEIATAAMAGIDLFDGLTPILAALNDTYLTPEGPLDADTLQTLPCTCPACHRTQTPQDLTRETLTQHNQHAQHAETQRVHHAIHQGRLRELVETRSRSNPQHVATYQRYDQDHATFFEQRAPSIRETPLPILSEQTHHRPEITRWFTKLQNTYQPPPSAQTLIVLPCAATKPYQNSPTHQRIRPKIEHTAHGRAHTVTLTSPLGAVPEELELTYPAAHYDVPVTGDWTPHETERIQQAFQHIWKNGDYTNAILHLPPDEARILTPILDAETTVKPGEHPTSNDALERLQNTVTQATRGLEATGHEDLFKEHMDNRIDWQFGPGTSDTLAQDATIRGRYPYLKLMTDDTQLLMLKPERGALTLTLEGGQRLFDATDAFNIEIDDFHPKGDVFAPGVLDASDTIRIEDEVIIHHDGELRAVGRATAPGPEMVQLEGGSCAEVRHHA